MSSFVRRSAVEKKCTPERRSTKQILLMLTVVAVLILGLSSLIIAARALKIHHKVLHGVAKTDKKLEYQQQVDIKVLSEITISLDTVSEEMEKSAQQILKQFSDDETEFNHLKRRLDNLLRDMKQSSHEVMEYVMDAIKETDVRVKTNVNGQTEVLQEICDMLVEHKTKMQLVHDNMNKVHSHHQEHRNALNRLRVNTMDQSNILKNISYQINSNWTDSNWDDLIGITTPSPIKKCDRGWRKYHGRCYFFHECTRYHKCSANSAAAACKKKGALLTRVRSSAHQAFLRHFIWTKPIFVDGHDDRSGTWRWTNGELIHNSWGDDGTTGPTGTNCVFISTYYRDDLRRNECSREYEDSYVCEI